MRSRFSGLSRALFLIVSCVWGALCAGGAGTAERPNFIIILADDQGYQDLGCFGSPDIKTPNIDRMAREGTRLTSFYAQAVCGPSRAALMTGSYPIRVGEPGNRKNQHTIPHTREVTIAEVLKGAGYQTACIGKWHLGQPKGGGWDPATMPNGQGFDYFYGTPLYNGFTVHVDDTNFRSPILRNQEVVVPSVESWDHITRDYTVEAVRYLREHRDAPFFLYLAHNLPHIPLGASEDFRGRSAGGPFGDAVEEIDWSTGEILKTLKELGLDERTLVVYTSDNGPWIETTHGNAPGGKPFIPRDHSGHADPLRGYKMVTWEGGLRVPCVVRWPGKVPAGRSSGAMAATIDLLPTFAGLAGAALPADRTLDGRNLWPLLSGALDASPHEALYYYSYTHLQAVRDAHWKLVLPRPEFPKWTGFSGRFHGDGVERIELYDLGADVSEVRDVSREHPEEVARLLRVVEAAREDLGDYDRVGQGERFYDPGPRRPEVAAWKEGGEAMISRPALAKYDGKAPVGNLRFDFETGDLQGWRVVEGRFEMPVSNRESLPRWKQSPFPKQGRYHLSTIAVPEPKLADDTQTGVLESPAFRIEGGRMSFLVGGGDSPETCVMLVDAGGHELRRAGGPNGPQMRRVDWDVSDLRGETVRLRVIDHRTSNWGHVTFDDFSAEGELVK